jgi:hypothetical protein
MLPIRDARAVEDPRRRLGCHNDGTPFVTLENSNHVNY